MFPEGFITETLETLALLFPTYNQSTRTWYQITRSKTSFPLDPHLLDIGVVHAERRQIQHFHFWHDRLVALKESYDEARPKTLKQWWYDNRNGVQWYMFWVTLLALPLAIFFGLIQCVEGALQAYKAFNP